MNSRSRRPTLLFGLAVFGAALAARLQGWMPPEATNAFMAFGGVVGGVSILGGTKTRRFLISEAELSYGNAGTNNGRRWPREPIALVELSRLVRREHTNGRRPGSQRWRVSIKNDVGEEFPAGFVFSGADDASSFAQELSGLLGVGLVRGE